MTLLKVDFNPVSEFTDFVHNPYVNLPLGLDINKAVIYLWLTAAVAMGVTLLIVRRGLKLRPDGSPLDTGVIPPMPLPRRMFAGALTEHDDVRERVAAEPIGAVHTDAGTFTCRVEAGEAEIVRGRTCA